MVFVSSREGDFDIDGKENMELEHLLEPLKPLPLFPDKFLVSFMVDARGGSMRGSRHLGLHVLVPPNAASAPTRLTCRMLRPERTTRPPQLNDGEGLACRIIELGPYPRTFNSPVLFEIPYYSSLCGRERELVILRSDNAETWREHSLEATDQAVQSAVGRNFDTLETSEELKRKRILRILTNEFPQFLAVVSRLRQESAIIGSDGGVLSSSVIPQVQAVFPEGALQKRIRVGLQAHPINPDTVKRVMGSRVTVSPIVTLEPRRRKFHKPITLTIPLPQSSSHSLANRNKTELKAQDAPSLRLLCSIAGGTLPAHWEDITGTTPLSKVKDCVSFTTIVSARFWLVDCPVAMDLVNMMGNLYHDGNLVPYMGKFVVFAKRLDNDEALIRCFCTTDDKIDKTLECQEGFELVAASPEVEVLDARSIRLEVGGNLQPVAKVGDSLELQFYSFYENRLAFPVRIKDLQADPVGKLFFFREWITPASGDDSENRPICVLEVNLSGEGQIPPHLALSNQALTSVTADSMGSLPCVFPHGHEGSSLADGDDADLMAAGGRIWMNNYASGLLARGQLDLVRVASEVGSDWPALAAVLVPTSGLQSHSTVHQLVDWITASEPKWRAMRAGDAAEAADMHYSPSGFADMTTSELRNERDRALALLLAWKEERREAATGNELERALRSIGRMDVVKSCMLDIAIVTDPNEYVSASRLIDGSPQVSRNAAPAQSEDIEATTTSLVDSAILAADATTVSAAPPVAPDAHIDIDEASSELVTLTSSEAKDRDVAWGQSSPPPVITTSDQAGDPMLLGPPTQASADEVDMTRGSESMEDDEESSELASGEVKPCEVTDIIAEHVPATEEHHGELVVDDSQSETKEVDLEVVSVTGTESHIVASEAPTQSEVDSSLEQHAYPEEPQVSVADISTDLSHTPEDVQHDSSEAVQELDSSESIVVDEISSGAQPVIVESTDPTHLSHDTEESEQLSSELAQDSVALSACDEPSLEAPPIVSMADDSSEISPSSDLQQPFSVGYLYHDSSTALVDDNSPPEEQSAVSVTTDATQSASAPAYPTEDPQEDEASIGAEVSHPEESSALVGNDAEIRKEASDQDVVVETRGGGEEEEGSQSKGPADHTAQDSAELVEGPDEHRAEYVVDTHHTGEAAVDADTSDQIKVVLDESWPTVNDDNLQDAHHGVAPDQQQQQP